jgi:2-deoxy-D-gluconate 3-dehydrogenase
MGAFDLSGRVAVVTGGNGGIGLGIAEGLAQAGAAVAIAARDAEKNEVAAGCVRALGVDGIAVETHVEDPESCKAMAETVVGHFGRLDILVNNAGIFIRKQPEDITFPEWQSVLTVNLAGAFLCAQAAYPAMVRQGGGKIINLGSLASIFGTAASAAYAASKGGIVQLTKSLAVSWGRQNIQVNAILPGYIESELSRREQLQRPGLMDASIARTPAGRWGTPADIAGLAVFLASPASDFITATSIPVDGGYSAQI